MKNKNRPNIFNRSDGTINFKLSVMIPIGFVVFIVSVVAFYEGRKAYWDYQVDKMCEKDGGVQIIEKVNITRKDAMALGDNNGIISVPVKNLATSDVPLYSVTKIKWLQKSYPKVSRRNVSIIRRVDNKVVAKWVFYSRVGGDFPSFAHPSSFSCPELPNITLELQNLFIIKGVSK